MKPAHEPSAGPQIVVTHLEMTEPPRRLPRPPPLKKLALLLAEAPTVSFYRYLYNTVGEPWLWTDRRLLSDEALLALLRDPRMSLHVLYLAGTPAGFAELFRHPDRTTELVYFGLVPEFIGMRLGPFFLDAVIDIAWLDAPRRIIVQTSTLDHPKALGLYQRAGFRATGQEVVIKNDGGPA